MTLESVGQRIETASPPQIALAVTCLAVTVLAVDYLLGPEVSSSFFYVLPLAIVSWRFGRVGAVVGSLAAAGAWLAIDIVSDPATEIVVQVWNSGVRLAFFLTIGGLLVGLRSALDRQIELSRVDPLTGLLNRRAFDELAGREFARLARTGPPVTVAMFDLDDFKSINDRAGHAAGDAALRAVAGVLTSCLRETDVAARMGGDEFAVVLIGEEVEPVLDRLQKRLAAASIDDRPLGCSIGAHTALSGTLESAMAHADQNLYAAKSAGKGRMVATVERSASASARVS